MLSCGSMYASGPVTSAAARTESQNYVNMLFFCKLTVFGKKKLLQWSWVCCADMVGWKKSGCSLAFFNTSRNISIKKKKQLPILVDMMSISDTFSDMQHFPCCHLSSCPSYVCVLYSVVVKLLHVLKLSSAKPPEISSDCIHLHFSSFCLLNKSTFVYKSWTHQLGVTGVVTTSNMLANKSVLY